MHGWISCTTVYPPLSVALPDALISVRGVAGDFTITMLNDEHA